MDNLFTEVNRNTYCPVNIDCWNAELDIFPDQYPIWTDFFPCHNLESFRRDVWLCPTRRTRIFHRRTEPDSREMPRFHEHFMQLHHSSDLRWPVPK